MRCRNPSLAREAGELDHVARPEVGERLLYLPVRLAVDGDAGRRYQPYEALGVLAAEVAEVRHGSVEVRVALIDLTSVPGVIQVPLVGRRPGFAVRRFRHPLCQRFEVVLLSVVDFYRQQSEQVLGHDCPPLSVRARTTTSPASVWWSGPSPIFAPLV